MVTFSYIDSGFSRPSSFASHLAAYRLLLQKLNNFRFLYIAAKEAYFHGVEERFRSLIKRPLEADWSNEVLKYFEIRAKWERQEYIIPVTEDLEFLRDAQERFRSSGIESLYQSWRLGELGTRELRAKISQQRPERAIFFDTYLVSGHRSLLTENARQGDRSMRQTQPGQVRRVPRCQPVLRRQ